MVYPIGQAILFPVDGSGFEKPCLGHPEARNLDPAFSNTDTTTFVFHAHNVMSQFIYFYLNYYIYFHTVLYCILTGAERGL